MHDWILMLSLAFGPTIAVFVILWAFGGLE